MYSNDIDHSDDRHDPALHPPTPEEQQAMIEAISVMQAVSLLRERGYAVVEPVDMDDEAVTP